MMIKLYNVIDKRTNQFHSVAIILDKNLKWFEEVVVDENNISEEE